MRRIIILFCCSFLSQAYVQAQSSQDSIKTVIQTLFKGMNEADGAAIRAIFADSAVMQTIVTSKSGAVQVRDESVNDFAAFVAKSKKGLADERIEFGTILVDDHLASVWTPYQFYYDGKFSHCGVNSFQLVRGGEGWKIQYLIDTRRKQPCN
jgi:hypothetical protein